MFRLRELRQSRNLTQKEFSAILGVSPALVGFYENEINHPAPDMLIKIADYFACSIDYLVGREDELGNVILASEALSESEQRLVELFRAMPEARRRTVLDMMQAMTDGSNANVKKTHA